jgi:hypothetical protein
MIATQGCGHGLHASRAHLLWWRTCNRLRAWRCRFGEPCVAAMEEQVETALYSTRRDYRVRVRMANWQTEEALSGR